MSKGFTSKVTPPAEHTYMTPEEIAARDEAGYQPEPTAFRQIPPDDNSGLNMASPGVERRGGDFKFSSGV